MEARNAITAFMCVFEFEKASNVAIVLYIYLYVMKLRTGCLNMLHIKRRINVHMSDKIERSSIKIIPQSAMPALFLGWSLGKLSTIPVESAIWISAFHLPLAILSLIRDPCINILFQLNPFELKVDDRYIMLKWEILSGYMILTSGLLSDSHVSSDLK